MSTPKPLPGQEMIAEVKEQVAAAQTLEEMKAAMIEFLTRLSTRIG